MAEGKGHARLGNLSFRLDPEQIRYAYQVNYSTIDTIGGQVIQVLGATLGDITIVGSFGENRNQGLESWQLAESFHAQIKTMIDAQTRALRSKQGTGQGVTHQPVTFSYQDGVHDWNFKVLIKGIADPAGGSVTHRTGRSNYEYQLTLFLVEDATLSLKKITTDQFIARISSGLGWKASAYNGVATLNEAINFIQSNSTNGVLTGYLENLVSGQVNLDVAQATTNPTNANSTPKTSADATGGPNRLN